MSNTVLILANAYEEFCNKRRERKRNGGNRINNNSRVRWTALFDFIKNNKCMNAMIILVILGIIVFVIGAFKKKNIILIISLALYIIGIIGMVLSVEKKEVKNYRVRRRAYYRDIRLFNNVLKYEFKIDSKEKIELLLDECDKTSKNIGQKVRLTGNFDETWIGIIYPIITTIVTIVLGVDNIKNNLTLDNIIIGCITLVTIVIMMRLFLKLVQSIIEPFINSDKNRINTLIYVLNDIYLNEYV